MVEPNAKALASPEMRTEAVSALDPKWTDKRCDASSAQILNVMLAFRVVSRATIVTQQSVMFIFFVPEKPPKGTTT
jgi:hypothetical protein